jgi:hypothetical protein
MYKKLSAWLMLVAATAIISSGCVLHDVAKDTRGMDLNSDGKESLGHIASTNYYLSILWILPIYPDPGANKVQYQYDAVVKESEKFGATGFTDLVSAKGSFPFPLFPFIVIHFDKMSANMFKE